MRLKGKVSIITGSGSGMGRAASILFAKEGSLVLGVDCNESAGCETNELIRKEGGEADFVQADVSSSQDVRNMIKFAVERYGRVDILYNNAGISSRPFGDGSYIVDIPEECYDKVQSVNLKSVFLCCKYTIPELIKSGGGSIINTSSTAALIGGYLPGQFDSEKSVAMPNIYAATKGAVIALSRAIAIAYAPNNIRCNVLCPGSTDTPLLKPAGIDDKAIRQSWEKPIPLKRLGTPEDMAYAALYLASDESSYITGIILPVDGGWTAL